MLTKKAFHIFVFFTLLFTTINPGILLSKTLNRIPLRVVVDLRIGESQEIKLFNGDIVSVKLLDIIENCDEIRYAIRSAFVKVLVNGKEIVINSGNYNLPVTIANVQIDCPITKGYYKNSNSDAWGLEKDARLRLWPGGSLYISPGILVYPVLQRWFADDTWMSNETVDAEKNVLEKKVYYHYGIDIGGSEELIEVVSATNGLVISAGMDSLPGFEDTPVKPRYDVIYILDEHGWYYSYAHLHSINSSISPGTNVKMGQKLGLLGKEGASGGWSHLHFDIRCRQPSGKWGVEDAYAYIWEAYVHQYNPPLIAVTRPRHLSSTNQTVTLDATKSKSFVGEIIKYEWTFYDGTRAFGPIQKRKYSKPGIYSEILKVVDSKGNIDYDFSTVHVYEKENLLKFPPRIQANYYPTFGIKPGDPVIFKVRTFGTEFGWEKWDFGDGTPPEMVKSVMESEFSIKGKYAETTHSFDKPGHYIIRVERSNEYGYKAIAHLHIEVVDSKDN
jgi:murein DD-endopeptidase MepM/ murein hydrolase activator NlpD